LATDQSPERNARAHHADGEHGLCAIDTGNGDIQAIKAVVAKKCRPHRSREAVGWLQARGTSLRRACRVIGLSTATWRYQRRTNAKNLAVLERLQAHAAERG